MKYKSFIVNIKYNLYIKIIKNFYKYDELKDIDYRYKSFFKDDNSFQVFKFDTLTHDLILSHNVNGKPLLDIFKAWRFMYNLDVNDTVTSLIRYKLLSIFDSISLENIILRNSILLRYFTGSFVKDYIIIRQLLDDIFDYKIDKKLGKSTFVTLYGIKMARLQIKKAKARIFASKDTPKFLKYLLQYFY